MSRAAAPLLLFLVALGRAGLVAGQEATPKPSPVIDEEGAGIHFPQTAEDHLAIADEYTAKAAERRKEAGRHRGMIAAYEHLAADLSRQAVRPGKRAAKGPKAALAQYRAHCESYIQGAEWLAAEADKLAEFHRARARELKDQ